MEIALGALPGKLGELLQQEYELLFGAHGDVTFFQAEPSTMHAAVLRCEALEEPDVQISNWIAQVRDLAYDIEDCVDLFAHRVDAGTHDADATTYHRFSRWIHRITTIPDRHIIATELKELRARAVEVSELRKRYSLGPQMPSHHAPAVDPRLFALYADSAGLIGMDGPRDEVAGMVTGAGSDGLKVVSIVGMAGSGKTTLAREVYRLVNAGFKCLASVSVGRSSDVAKVLDDMLSQVDGEYSRGRGDAGDVAQLIGRLRQQLQDKRYLVMIDDLWSVQIRGIIKHCFPKNNLGSQIITTTRIEAVAKTAACAHVYRTCLLDEADAETLFSQRTFGSVGGNLKGTDVSELPEQIGQLRCLETLDVRSTKVKELPPSIVKLEKLMYLLTGNAKLPSGITKMNSLLTLSCSNIGKSADANIIQELSEMVSLSELEIFCNVTQTSGDKKQFTFPSDGFRSLKKLLIRCSLPSVTFVTDALSKVEVLELKCEGLSEELSGVSGIEHLSGLKHMIVEFSQHDAGTLKHRGVAAVKKTAEKVHPNWQVIIVRVDKKSTNRVLEHCAHLIPSMHEGCPDVIYFQLETVKGHLMIHFNTPPSTVFS